jgi:hypothetical protein
MSQFVKLIPGDLIHSSYYGVGCYLGATRHNSPGHGSWCHVFYFAYVPGKATSHCMLSSMDERTYTWRCDGLLMRPEGCLTWGDP